MSELVLSIVVAAFNVEKFIERCVTSIGNQTIDRRIEILVVNDGSRDRTGEILRGLVTHGEVRLRVIHQANCGVGAARNVGLESASGRYVWFVDGDDYVESGSVDKLLEVLVRNDPDVAVIDFSCADEAGLPIEWIRSPLTQDAGVIMQGGAFFARHFATTYTCMYVVKRSLLVDHDLRFQPRIKMQDAELIPRILSVADTVLISRINAYVYVKRAGSYMNSTDPVAREESFQSVLEVRRRLEAFRHDVADQNMLAGLAAKMGSIRRILLLAFVYDEIDRSSLRNRLDLLKADGVYPFVPWQDETVKESLIRSAVNLCPILFPPLFRSFRKAFNVLRAPRKSLARGKS